jgi:hypothetical protein
MNDDSDGGLQSVWSQVSGLGRLWAVAEVRPWVTGVGC